ncbi:MAG: phage minor head protein [Meiothermus sp.]|nr:phage minor head protein [Meiothermus sp.]
MPWSVDPNPVDPAEAIAWFRARLPLTDPQFRALEAEARARAFFVSGLTRLELVQQVFDRLDSALAKGDTLEEFKAGLPAALQGAWGTGSAHRLGLIFDTNLQSAYGAGRWKSADAVRESRPFWGLAVVLDGRTSKICLNLRGVIRPADDPFWDTHVPPLHYRCRTALVTYSREQAEARGVTPTPPLQPPLEGFGAPPGRQAWSPDEADYHPQLWAAYQQLRPTPAAVEEEKPKEGVQFYVLESKIPKKDQAEVLRGINTAGLIEWMKTRPVAEINLGTIRRPNANGMFTRWPATGKTRIDVRSTRKPETYGATFEPGKSWSVSSCGTDKLDAMKRTLVHELGHHLWYSDEAKVAPIVRAAFAKATPITEYAKANAHEYFSETFAAYAFHRGVLRQFDPEGYAMIEEVKKVLGIP